MQSRRFLLDCVWAEPRPGGGVDGLRRDQVAFDSLTLDQANQRAYHFDFDGARNRLELEARAQVLARQKLLRDEFEAWFINMVSTKELDSQTWAQLHRRLADEGVPVSEYIGMLRRGC